jgi:flagellar motility protein MotE (MotC chaperone)
MKLFNFNQTKKKQTYSPQRRLIKFLRILPVTIMVTTLMMVLRLDDIYERIRNHNPNIIEINRSEAQPTPQNDQSKPSTASPLPPATIAESLGEGDINGNVKAETQSKLPNHFSQNELAVLQKLSERRETLDQRQRDLDSREILIKAAEERINQKINDMKTIQNNIQQMMKQVEDEDDAKVRSLIKIYESMKPKEVAKILEQLDTPVLLSIVTRMKEQKLVPIMEVLKPDISRSITDAMMVKRAARIEGKIDGTQ